MHMEMAEQKRSVGKTLPARQGSMARVLRTELRRAFGGWSVWAGAMLMFGVLVFPVATDIFQGGNPSASNAIERFLLAFVTSGAPFLAPVICCLPMGVSFCDDCATGFGRAMIHRTGMGRYLIGRILATACSGGCTLFLGMALYVGFCLLVFTGSANDPNVAGTLNAYRDSGVYTWLPEGLDAGYWLMAAYAVQYFLWGAVWAVAALAISSFVANRYAALALPFIFANALWFLFARLKLYLFAPYSYLHPVWFFSSYWEVLLGLGVQMALFAGLFYMAGRRRLLYG